MKPGRNAQREKIVRGSKRVRAAVLTPLVALCTFSSHLQAQTNGRIAFTSDRSGSWQIYTMNPDGADQVQVTNLAPNDGTQSALPSISPDGRQLAFNYDAGDGFDLYVINIDGTGLRQLTTDHASLFPRWSPDGRELLLRRFRLQVRV